MARGAVGALLVVASLVGAGCIELPEVQKSSQNGCDLITATTKYKEYALVSASVKCELEGAGPNQHVLNGCRQYNGQSILFAAGGEIQAGAVAVRIADGSGALVVEATLLPSENATGTSKALAFSPSFTIETARSEDFAGRFAASVSCRA